MLQIYHQFLSGKTCYKIFLAELFNIIIVPTGTILAEKIKYQIFNLLKG